MQSRDSNFDARQDARIRAVPLPEGLLKRLRTAALADDEGLDASLREIPVPQGLAGRLKQAVLTDDQFLDEAVRNVPVPATLARRLHKEPRLRVALARTTQWVTAASLLLAIGLSYIGTVIAFLMLTFPGAESPRPDLGAISLIGEMAEDPDKVLEIPAGPSVVADESLDVGPYSGWPPSPPAIELADRAEPEPTPLQEVMRLFDASSPLAETYWGVLGSPVFDELPELKRVPGPKPRGIGLPLVRGANIDFLIEHGVGPFVFPAADAKLLVSHVPLDVDTSSYELTRRCLEDRKLPLAEDVRTEEFLQAVDYGFARPKDRAMALSVACGPSPFGGETKQMMQIGVRARDMQYAEHPPARLVLAVDVSASMRGGGRLEMVRRALRGAIQRLGPEDRISLVPFSEDAHLLIEDAGREDAEQLLAAIDMLTVEKSTNLGAGLRKAYAAARRWGLSEGTTTRVVLLTDGLTKLGLKTTNLIRQRLVQAAGEGIRLEVIELGQDKKIDPQLADFAGAAEGRIRRATNADQLRWLLLETMTGKSRVAAAGVQLSVTFNPQAVLSYRLLGHESEVTAGRPLEIPQTDFHAGQTATALYEIQLKPGGSKDVANVELIWQEPEGEWSQLIYRHVKRKQFASSLAKAPLSLQEAILVAQAAEVLRKSPFARGQDKSRSFGWVLQLAGQVDERLYERPTFVEFIELLRRAEGAR